MYRENEVEYTLNGETYIHHIYRDNIKTKYTCTIYTPDIQVPKLHQIFRYHIYTKNIGTIYTADI